MNEQMNLMQQDQGIPELQLPSCLEVDTVLSDPIISNQDTHSHSQATTAPTTARPAISNGAPTAHPKAATMKYRPKLSGTTSHTAKMHAQANFQPAQTSRSLTWAQRGTKESSSAPTAKPLDWEKKIGRVCRFWLKGTCAKEGTCGFLHEQPPARSASGQGDRAAAQSKPPVPTSRISIHESGVPVSRPVPPLRRQACAECMQVMPREELLEDVDDTGLLYCNDCWDEYEEELLQAEVLRESAAQARNPGAVAAVLGPGGGKGISQVRCRFFNKGRCKYGSGCRFLHERCAASPEISSVNFKVAIFDDAPVAAKEKNIQDKLFQDGKAFPAYPPSDLGPKEAEQWFEDTLKAKLLSVGGGPIQGGPLTNPGAGGVCKPACIRSVKSFIAARGSIFEMTDGDKSGSILVSLAQCPCGSGEFGADCLWCIRTT
ncbi:hypothetical protein CYMTET_37727 [Cymbomonas tetramitiformis]|uniref:C3H1-type domain-containing protein n=1 Tax=Cymbomonas tetramitiformis TaxID=36881 RepID=A0AAE0F6D1_9CHLO|nr:hypothetical protein CYMTET_37727 [Cymbomonas tetramitiformis]